MKFGNIINEAFNRPVLLDPAYAGFFYAYLSQRVGAGGLLIDGELLNKAEMQEAASMYSGRGRSDDERSYRIQDGIAIIPVVGTLMNRGGWLSSMSGGKSYKGLQSQVNEALEDRDVKGIFFDIDSPGGAVSGCFDFCDYLAEIDKPSASFADEQIASAAYAIASQTGRIYSPRTGGLGSVGVIWVHKDYSESYSQAGIQVTIVNAGSHKADGNPYEPLPEAVRADIQSGLEKTRQLFAETVARGRGMGVQAVLDTEAQVYTGQAAVDIGFADAVMSKDDAFADFVQRVNAQSSQQQTSFMSTSSAGGDGSTVSMQPAFEGEPETLTGASEAMSEQAEEARAEGADKAFSAADVQAAVVTERERIMGILGHENAEGRMETAIQLAGQEGMTAESASVILETVPKASAGADVNAQALTMMADATSVDVETTDEQRAEQPAVAIIP